MNLFNELRCVVSDRPSIAGEATRQWATTTLEPAVDEPVERRRDGQRQAELSGERHQRVGASQRLARPLLDTIAPLNAEVGVVELVQGREGDHRQRECA